MILRVFRLLYLVEDVMLMRIIGSGVGWDAHEGLFCRTWGLPKLRFHTKTWLLMLH